MCPLDAQDTPLSGLLTEASPVLDEFDRSTEEVLTRWPDAMSSAANGFDVSRGNTRSSTTESEQGRGVGVTMASRRLDIALSD